MAQNVVTIVAGAYTETANTAWFSGTALSATTGAFTDATDSSSTTTGSLKTAGGLGVAKALWVGGLANFAGAVSTGALTASSATIDGTLSNSYKGANSDGFNIWVGGGGQSSVGAAGLTYKGGYNVGIGLTALKSNTTGYRNTAIGNDASYTNQDGHNNAALGYQSLYLNLSGTYNTAVGAIALYKTTGSSNTSVGFESMYNNTTGAGNSAFGMDTLANNIGGAYNSAFGKNGLLNVSSGGSNTAIGYNTGLGITTGSNNTILGANVTGLAAGLASNIIIANGAGTIKAQHDGTNWTLSGQATATTVKVTSAGGYISSDNSTGITTTVTTASLVGKTITIKDGIITGFA